MERLGNAEGEINTNSPVPFMPKPSLLKLQPKAGVSGDYSLCSGSGSKPAEHVSIGKTQLWILKD